MTLLILYIIIAIGVSFICSVLEAVLLSVSVTFIAQIKQKNGYAGKVLEKTKRDIDQSISSILILNTFAHTMGAAGVGAQAVRVYGERWETLIAFLLTLAILYFSEIIPKTLGVIFWRKLAIPSAYMISFLVKIIFPLVWLATRVTLLFRRKRDETVGREEILAFSALSCAAGEIMTQENQLLENIFKLREVKVVDILTPRTVMHVLSETMTVKDALSCEQTTVFTRIPTYRDDIDQITGLIIKSQLYECERHGGGDTPLKNIKLPIHRVSEKLPVLNALDLFIKRHEQLFLVEDHFGQTVGVVTLEDAIETLLGREIVDESDQVEDMQKLAKARYRNKLRNDPKF